MGRFDESIAEDKRALKLDPLSAAVNADLRWDLYLARRYDEAIEQLRIAIDLEPNYWVSRVLLGRCYEQKGKLHDAVEEFKRPDRLRIPSPRCWRAGTRLRTGRAKSGGHENSQRLADAIEKRICALVRHRHDLCWTRDERRGDSGTRQVLCRRFVLRDPS